MKNLNKIVLSALFMSLGLALPFLTGQIQQIGNMLLPMHIPVFLCGLICGWKYGLIVGLLTPLTRSLWLGMPLFFPNAVSMAFELAAYGSVSGLMYSHLPWKCIKSLYKSMIVAMIAGRIVWGISQTILLAYGDSAFTFGMFISGALINAVPGIILQLIIIPAVMVSLKRAKLVPLIKR